MRATAIGYFSGFIMAAAIPGIADTVQVQSNSLISIGGGGKGSRNEINIGVIGKTVCQTKDNALSIASFSGDRRTLKVNQKGRFLLCMNGSQNRLHVAKDSEIDQILVEGSENHIEIGKGSTVNLIKIKGKNNTVKLPKQMFSRLIEIGEGNQIVKY